MRKIAALIAALLLSLGLAPAPEAARDRADTPATRLELLVVEVQGCNICGLVRSHIQPVYEASPRSRQVPMRYVDITSTDELQLGLATRVETVPTVVLMRDGREVDRISGYLGPQNFFAVLNEMLELAAAN